MIDKVTGGVINELNILVESEINKYLLHYVDAISAQLDIVTKLDHCIIAPCINGHKNYVYTIFLEEIYIQLTKVRTSFLY